MKKMLIIGLLLAWSGHAAAQDETVAVCWNLENFFDYFDDGASPSDHEFSSRGERHWTKKRFGAKCQAVAKALLWIGDRMGGMPDVIGFEEIENRLVLKRLLTETALRKLDYQIVHFDSPDPRGIDVALLYRSTRWQLLSAKPCHVQDSSFHGLSPEAQYTSFHGLSVESPFRTRDILAVRLARRDGSDTLDFLVCHLPSKYGGARLSAERREVAVDRLRAVADSLAADGNGRIIAMGDFNDTPDQPVFRRLEPRLQPLSMDLQHRGKGSIRYEGVWELIDLVFASESLADRCLVDVVEVPFLMSRDGTHPGDKPLRTWSGPRYLGGVSDHCPVVLRILGKSLTL